MARFPGDTNNDGMDDDVDRQPGNERQSASLARREDPRSEQEYSNLLSVQNQIQERAYAEARHSRNMREAMHAAQQDVHFFPDVGKFVIPPENTWAAHAELVLDNDMRLHFNPDKYFFDKIIADKLKIKALTDRNHPDFAKYKGLRTNLEVLRNDIIGQYLSDGGFDPGDEVYIEPIRGIAEALGNALANDVWWKRPFVDHFALDVANVEAVGAAEMYKYLLREQDKGGIIDTIGRAVRDLLGQPTQNWGLLNLEDSPFSPEALSAPPPAMERMVQPMEVTPLQQAEHRAMESLALISKTNKQFKPVDSIAAPEKAMSVEDGRTILRWLRNLKGMDMDVQDFLSAGTPAEQQAKAEALGNLVALYSMQTANVPQMASIPEVKDGSDAAGGAATMIAEHAMTLLPPGHPSYDLLADAIDAQPAAHYERSSQSVSRLLEHMEAGLAKMSGRQLNERSVVERLLEASDRIHTQAKQLRSVDTLTSPRREESVELGREILRKLRNLAFSDRPIDELVNSGKPEEKMEAAEKLDELIEIYRGILTEALVANPGLADDPRIKAANDAVGSASHGIKLMAAKEIPSTAAATQQIQADITQQPEEWKKLDGKTVNRLLDSMEGGLAAAVDAVDSQDQQAEKDAEIAQDAIDSSLMQQETGRRKRRKKRQQKSGMGARKAEKMMRETMADDRAAGQGRFAEEAQQKKEDGRSAYMGLNANDMAAIRSLGGALAGANREAVNLAPVDVNANMSITPDGQTNAERAIENIKTSRRNQRTTK